MGNRLHYAAIALLLGGCGGADNSPASPPVKPPSESLYRASSQATSGGALSPSIQTVAAGKTAVFEVRAVQGFVLERISG
ncbi:MAG: hypothetical protein ACRDA8_07840, partial [Shewanella sp.]